MRQYGIKSVLMSLMLVIFFVYAKSQDVTIQVKNKNKEPLIGATVKLIDSKDSSIIFMAAADLYGTAVFKNIPGSLYNVSISYIGFINAEKTIAINRQNKTFSFVLEENSLSLNEVTISANRPFIRQEEDKMVVDPTPMIGISTNTLEVIEATPGIYVDYDAGIFLSASAPATIYINGREQKISTQDIMNLLRNLPPGSIERIEILRTPSTKYDAASSGGIVNVVLKKGLKIGRFGNINAGMNQKIYGNRTLGISFNNGGDKTSMYLNVGFNRNDQMDEMQVKRNLTSDTALNQKSKTRKTSNNSFIGYGITWDIDSTIALSYDGRFGLTDNKSTGNNNNYFSGLLDEHIVENNDMVKTKGTQYNLAQDISLILKNDSNDLNWTTLLGFDFSKNSAEQLYTTDFIIPFDTSFSRQMNNFQNRNAIQLQSDISFRIINKIKAETGIKGSFQTYGSETNYYFISNNIQTNDIKRNNSYNFREGVFAAYAQTSKTFYEGLVLKTGCRFEYTYMNGHQLLPNDTSFLVNRGDFFPYVYLSQDLPTLLKNIIPINLRAFIIYRKTIMRPSYAQLNPSHKQMDTYFYEAGNPNLKPQFTNNFEFNISYEDMPVFALGINRTNDIFSEVTYNDTIENGIALMTYDNIGKNIEKYIRGMIGIPPGGRYFFAIGAQYNHNNYNGYYQNTPLNLKKGSWRFFSFHSLKLSKHTKLSFSGFLMTNGLRGFYELKNFGALNCGLTQTFLNQKLIITLNARDILGTMNTAFVLNQGLFPSSGERSFDSQRIGINIRYNFGLPQRQKHFDFNELDDN